MGPHVPYPVSIPIFAGALAWSRRHRKPVTFRCLCFSAGVMFASDVYFHLYASDVEIFRAFSGKSLSGCALMVLSAVFGDWGTNHEQSSTSSADRSEEDTEAARDAKFTTSHAEPPQPSPSESRSKISSLMAYISGRLPTIGTAAAMALIAVAATAIHHPPTFADEYLSILNCKAQMTKLDFDNQHFEFTATSTTKTFLRSCSEPQQLWALEKIMNAHINESDATCGVYCVRRADDGQLFGYISQVRYGLVDMYYCRGGYGSFGPDCEAEGEEYGYDIEKEGWMDDVYEPWNVLEQDVDVV